MTRPARYLAVAGRPTFLIGANYWSRVGGPRMWSRFDEDRVDAELAEMHALGMNACRAFAFLPDMMPTPGRVDARAVERFGRFLALAKKREVAVLPTLLVGHMSGENYDFPGQRGRSPIRDRTVLKWQHTLARALAEVASRHGEVVAWVLSNEMPLWTGAERVSDVTAWASALKTTFARHAPGVPVGIGDGVMNMKGGQNGYDAPALAEVADYLGPHTYTADLDSFRQALWPELCVRALQQHGLPVVLEEFGGSSAQASPENLAAFYRETIHSVFAVGGAGVLGWCFSDFAPEREGREPPYHHHAFELGFGLTSHEGVPRPAAHELERAQAVLGAMKLAELELAPVEAAIVVPSYYRTTYPFSAEDRTRMRRTLTQAYALAAKAGIEAHLVDEEGNDFSGYRLILVPATQKLLVSTWQALRARAAAGAVVYASYYAGDFEFHQGHWIDDFEATTGCVHELRYGCFDLPDHEVILAIDDGAQELTLRTTTSHGSPYGRARLPISPRAATVIGRDQQGRPALVRHAVGTGACYFLAYPWEHYLAQQGEVNAADGSHVLYRYLAEQAKLANLAPVLANPLVQVHRGRLAGSEIAWLINRSWSATEVSWPEDPLGAEWLLPAGAPVLPTSDGTAIRVALGPKEVRILKNRNR